MLKVVVFDLDGTLCPVGKAITPETIAGLRALREAGVRVAFSSGKPVYYLCGTARQAGLPDVILMGENGADAQFGVDLPPKVWYRMPVAEHTRAALAALKEQLAAEFGRRIWLQPTQIEVTPFFPPEDEGLHNELRDFMARHVKAEMDVTIYDQRDCFDLCPTGLDKGSGLAYLCEQMGWTLAEAAAVGDGVNDEPMLRAAGVSVGIGAVPVAGAKAMARDINEAIALLLKQV